MYVKLAGSIVCIVWAWNLLYLIIMRCVCTYNNNITYVHDTMHNTSLLITLKHTLRTQKQKIFSCRAGLQSTWKLLRYCSEIIPLHPWAISLWLLPSARNLAVVPSWSRERWFKIETKRIKKNSNPSICSKKRSWMGFFSHSESESKSGLYFVLTLLLHRFLTTF